MFTILGDKTKIQDKLQFTKLCSYFKEKNICPHKDTCRFAHSLTELRVSECLFKDKCRLIKYQNGIVYNVSKTKLCEHKHKGETLHDYHSRIGINSLDDGEKISIKKIFL